MKIYPEIFTEARLREAKEQEEQGPLSPTNHPTAEDQASYEEWVLTTGLNFYFPSPNS